MTTSLLLTFAAVLFSWVGGPYPDSHPVIALERAVQMEEIEHDWNSASFLYLGLTQPEVPAWIRMEAEIRYARCQLKLGRPADAEKSLQNLAGRLRSERVPDAKAGEAAPDTTQSRIEAAMKELASSAGADRTRLVEAAIDGMARTLSRNGGYINPQDIETLTGEFAGIGAVLAGGDHITIRETVPGSSAEKAGVPMGSQILEIDGKTPFALGGSLQNVVAALRGAAGTSVKLNLKLPGGELKEYTLQRARVEFQQMSCSPLLTGEKGAPAQTYWLDEASGIAGVTVHYMGTDTPQKLQAILSGPPFTGGKVKGFVLDLSNNGGGALESGKQIADFFLKEGVILGVKTKDDISLKKADAAELLAGVPMAVVVSRKTASSAELVTSALQDNRRAVIVGERTFGRGEIMTLKNLPGGGAIKVPSGEMLRASGKGLERREGMADKDVWGVTPDIAIPSPPRDANPLTDEAAKALFHQSLDAALDHLKKANAN